MQGTLFVRLADVDRYEADEVHTLLSCAPRIDTT